MSFAPQGVGSSRGLAESVAAGDRSRVEQMILAPLGFANKNPLQSQGPVQNELSNSLSPKPMVYQQQQYSGGYSVRGTGEQLYSPQSLGEVYSPLSFKDKAQMYSDYNTQLNTGNSGIYQKSQTGNSGVYQKASTEQINDQTPQEKSPYIMSVLMGMNGMTDKEMNDRMEREKVVRQVRESQQLQQKQSPMMKQSLERQGEQESQFEKVKRSGVTRPTQQDLVDEQRRREEIQQEQKREELMNKDKLLKDEQRRKEEQAQKEEKRRREEILIKEQAQKEEQKRREEMMIKDQALKEEQRRREEMMMKEQAQKEEQRRREEMMIKEQASKEEQRKKDELMRMEMLQRQQQQQIEMERQQIELKRQQLEQEQSEHERARQKEEFLQEQREQEQEDYYKQREHEQEEYFKQQREQEEYYKQQREQEHQSMLEQQQQQILEQQQMLEQMRIAVQQQQQQQLLQSQQLQQQQQLLQSQKGGNSRDPPLSVKRGANGKQFMQSSVKERSVMVSSPDGSAVDKRLDIIETSLSRMCNQHDALMPLLQLLETVPSLQRSEQQVKNLTKKYAEVEKRMKEFETSEKRDSQYQHTFNNIERNFKSTNSQITQLKKDIIAIETKNAQVSHSSEMQLKEDTLNLYKQVDSKLDRNLRDVKSLLADFKNQITLSVKRGQLVASPEEDLSSPIRTFNEINAKIENQTRQFNNLSSQLNNYAGQLELQQQQLQEKQQNQQLNHLTLKQQQHHKPNEMSEQLNHQDQVNIDITNIYREIGMLRSEMELLLNQQRRELIHEQLQKMPSPTESERALFIAGLEENMFLQEMECFDSLNQQRLQNELELLEDKLHLLNIDIETIQQSPDQGQSPNLISSRIMDPESVSHNLLIEQYAHQQGSDPNMTSPQVSQIDILGYEMKFIGDRIFNFKHQIHGTKKKYLCDCRRLEDRLHSLHFLSQEAQQEGTDNQVINRICQIDKLQGRVDAINNSVGDHVSILLQKLTNLENSFSNTKSAFKNLKYVPLS